MSSMILNGDTSGAITVTVPAVAGTNTVTIPAAAGTVMVSGNMPTFSYYETTTATSLGNVSFTKITFDANDNSAHTNAIEVGTGNGKQYNIVFKTENIKLIPGSYDVQISFKGISHFKNTKDDIQYWIAFEAKESKLGE